MILEVKAQRIPYAVTNVESLQLFAVIAHINQAVRQYAIHVEDEQADILRFWS